jgi:hypothetical protein
MSTEWFYEPLSIGGFAVKQKNPDGLRSNPISAVYLEEHALLIAAAPEMLQTLKLFYDWSKNVTKYPPYWVRTTFVDKCSEIIAKAEGRTP